MNAKLTLSDEELEELDQLLLSEQNRLLIEIRRSSPNSPFKAQLRHRVDVVNALIEKVASTHEATA